MLFVLISKMSSLDCSCSFVAIMQPYLFPYIGYFQLLSAAKFFVFYDDVNYISRGWINRNRILQNGSPLLFSVPMIEPSQNKLILESRCNVTPQWKDKFFKALKYSYGHCSNFSKINELISDVLQCGEQGIDHLSILSIHAVCSYLDLEFDSYRSSESFSSTLKLGRVERLCQITKSLNSSQYLNLPGGMQIYSQNEFAEYNVSLNFLCPSLSYYEQFSKNKKSTSFISGLSIIDVLMYCSKPHLLDLLGSYKIVETL